MRVPVSVVVYCEFEGLTCCCRPYEVEVVGSVHPACSYVICACYHSISSFDYVSIGGVCVCNAASNCLEGCCGFIHIRKVELKLEQVASCFVPEYALCLVGDCSAYCYCFIYKTYDCPFVACNVLRSVGIVKRRAYSHSFDRSNFEYCIVCDDYCVC